MFMTYPAAYFFSSPRESSFVFHLTIVVEILASSGGAGSSLPSFSTFFSSGACGAGGSCRLSPAISAAKTTDISLMCSIQLKSFKIKITVGPLHIIWEHTYIYIYIYIIEPVKHHIYIYIYIYIYLFIYVGLLGEA